MLKLHKFTAASCPPGTQAASLRYDQLKVFQSWIFITPLLPLWTVAESDPVSVGFAALKIVVTSRGTQI